MSHRLVLRPEVRDDLHEIVRYLDQHSEQAGDRFIESVFRALGRLTEMPGVGSPKQFRTRQIEPVRSWAVPDFRNYLIYYRVRSDTVQVIAVLHGARNVAKILRDRFKN